MINEELRSQISEIAGDDVIVFDNPSFDNAIIGISDDDRVIYAWDKMVLELMVDESMTYEDAVEFISYNTLRAAPYFGDKYPITMIYDRNDILEGW